MDQMTFSNSAPITSEHTINITLKYYPGRKQAVKVLITETHVEVTQ